MDEDGAKALAERIRAQGWRQGSKLPQRHDLFLADPNAPITPEAEEWASGHGGGEVSGIVHARRPDDPPMVIISQDCDLVAAPEIEPMVEAIPVVVVPEGDQLPQRNSARYFTLDAEKRMVADQTRKLVFEKSLLPDRDAEHYYEPGDQAESFRAWCARRYSRVPLPDDFNLVVGAALEWAWGRKGRSTDSRAQAMYSWRVILARANGGIDVAFIVPVDEKLAAESEVQGLVDELIGDAISRLEWARERAEKRFRNEIEIREFEISGAQARASEKVSLRALMDFPPLALEHFTFRGDEIVGAEPRSDSIP